MLHYVFIVGDYYRIASANGICVKALIDELVLRDNKVDVICNGDSFALNYSIQPDSVKIHTVHYEKKCSNMLDKTIEKVSGMASIANYPIRSLEQVRQYTQLLHQINENDMIDVVAVCQRPYAATQAGFDFKLENPKVKFVIYELDSLGNDLDLNLGLMMVFKSRCQRLEAKYYQSADAILHLESNRKLYESTRYSAYLNKSTFVDIPLMDNSFCKGRIQEENTGSQSNEAIKMLYGGVLIKEIREPDYIIRLVKEISKDTPCTLTFYSRGTCEKTLEKESSENACIRSKGYVAREVLDGEIVNADFLISIGNHFTQENNALPSKIFVYMSTGKPIIHVLSGNYDACKNYLIKYPNVLLLDPNEDFDRNLSALKQFIIEKKGTIAPFEEVCKLMYTNTPKYSVDVIESALDNRETV